MDSVTGTVWSVAGGVITINGASFPPLEQLNNLTITVGSYGCSNVTLENATQITCHLEQFATGSDLTVSVFIGSELNSDSAVFSILGMFLLT